MPPNSDASVRVDDAAEIDVVLPAHLHARPAGQLVMVAARFRSTLHITYRDKTVDVTGILAVMGLGAVAGSTITVRAQGEDAYHAVTEIAQLLRTID